MEARVEGVGSYRERREAGYGTHDHHRAASEKERELSLFGPCGAPSHPSFRSVSVTLVSPFLAPLLLSTWP